jgi:PleD family two-component response regulator
MAVAHHVGQLEGASMNRNLRILIATEVAEEREAIRGALARRRDVAKVVCVDDGVDAHIVARNEPIDVAILSSSIGKIDGVVLVRTMARSPVSRHVRTLLVLGPEVADRMREVIASRPSALVVRPFDPATLLDRLDQALEGSGAWRARAEQVAS